VPKKYWPLKDHFLLACIAAGVALVFYMIMLYSFEEKVTCIPKHCAESSGHSLTQESRSPSTTTGPTVTPSPFDAWTSEVRTSTDQRDGSWIPPLAGLTTG